MSIVTQVIKSEWFTRIKNGDNFTDLPLDTTKNIVGSIFEDVKVKFTVKIFTIGYTGSFYVKTDSIYSSGATYTQYVNVGDECRLVFKNSQSNSFRFRVDSVTDEIIYYTQISGTGPYLGYNNNYSDPDNKLVVETPLTFLKYDFGLRASDNPDEFYSSRLDDDTTGYNVTGIGLGSPRGTSFIDGEKRAINSHSGSFKVRFLQDSQIPILDVGSFNSAQEYEIEHIFRIQDYSAEDIQNYIDGTKPDNYLGDNTLDYNSNLEFRVIETNPETKKIGKFISEGNVGFFGENINGRPNKYSISDLTMVRVSTGLPIENLTSNEETLVNFRINSTESSFSSVPVIVLNHFAMITDYEFKDIEFDELFLNETQRIEGVSSALGNIFVEYEILSYTLSTIDVRFKINPNNSTIEGEQYKLSVLVGDSSINSNSTDKVQVTINNGTYSNAFDIEGLIGDAKIDLYLKDCTDFSLVGATSFPMIKGDLINTKFTLPVLDGTIDSIKLQTIAIDGGDIYTLDTLDVDLNGIQIIDGVQRIDEIIPALYSGSIDGSIKLVSGTTYEVLLPYRMPYDAEVPASNLPDLLFNPLLPNNGKNQDTFYIQTQGLNIHIAYTVGMMKDDRVTLYRFRTPVIQIKDFEQTL